MDFWAIANPQIRPDSRENPFTLAALAGRRERLEAMERDRDLILESYAALAPEALDALSPEERRKVYVILISSSSPWLTGA